MDNLIDMIDFGEDETKDTKEQHESRMKLRRVLENLSDEALEELQATLDFSEFAGTFRRLHQEFLQAQCIVFQVSWGKDAIKEAVLKTS